MGKNRLANKNNKRRRVVTISVVVTVCFAALLFIPYPYYIYAPGSVEDIKPKLEITGAKSDETGQLMLTTVYSIPVHNSLTFIYGLIYPHGELRKKEEIQLDYTDEEYKNLLKWMMESSTANALISAYQYMDRPVEVVHDGLILTHIEQGSKMGTAMQVGDVLHTVDGHNVEVLQDLLGLLDGYNVGDQVSLEFLRGDLPLKGKVELVSISSGRAGLGGVFDVKLSSPQQSDISFSTSDIGGPSAGLMLALEIIAQLGQGDLTKGYKLAGTGTIDASGNVGQIGGINHKVIAAAEEGVDYFFIPKDIKDRDTNEKVATSTVQDEELSLSLVPVATLADAVRFLEQLPIQAD